MEKIAKKSSLSEREVALETLSLARKSAAGEKDDDRESHVGFYLIDTGRHRLERCARPKSTAMDILRRTGRRFSLPLYLGTIFLLTAISAAGLLTESVQKAWTARFSGSSALSSLRP